MVREHGERVASCLARGQTVRRPLDATARVALARSYYVQPHNLSSHRKLALLAAVKLATAVAVLGAALEVAGAG